MAGLIIGVGREEVGRSKLWSRDPWLPVDGSGSGIGEGVVCAVVIVLFVWGF